MLWAGVGGGRGGCVWVGGRCTFAMVQSREKTFHELLRQTQKIPKPEVHDFLFPSLSHRIGFFCHLCGLQLMMNWGWTSFLINVILFCLTNLLKFLLCNSVIFMIFFCIVILSSRASSQCWHGLIGGHYNNRLHHQLPLLSLCLSLAVLTFLYPRSFNPTRKARRPSYFFLTVSWGHSFSLFCIRSANT